MKKDLNIRTEKIIEKLTNKRFGKLVVLKFDKMFNNRSYFICKCDCGVEKSICSNALGVNKNTSCGCGRKLRRKLPRAKPKVALRTLYTDNKYQAKSKNREFTLTIEEFEKIILSNCYICGNKPNNIEIPKTLINNDSLIHNGIDRYDSSKGYTIDNSKPCCSICNRMKMDQNFEAFIEHIKTISKYNNV